MNANMDANMDAKPVATQPEEQKSTVEDAPKSTGEEGTGDAQPVVGQWRNVGNKQCLQTLGPARDQHHRGRQRRGLLHVRRIRKRT